MRYQPRSEAAGVSVFRFARSAVVRGQAAQGLDEPVGDRLEVAMTPYRDLVTVGVHDPGPEER